MLDELIRLLKKIAKQGRPMGLEVSYNGQKWKWTVKFSNLRADEFCPQKSQLMEVGTKTDAGCSPESGP
jgi:hypothetical protein